MLNHPLARLDRDEKLRGKLLPFCRLKPGEVWRDRRGSHAVGCLNAASRGDVAKLCGNSLARLAIHDPPYNFIAFDRKRREEFVGWLRRVVSNTDEMLASDSSLYLWIGADQKNDF